ncbi:MAG: hypothetical protein ABTQ25_02510 [Nitrosomonas ureae]
MDMTPAIHMHGEQSNILIASEFDNQQNMLDIQMAKTIAEALNLAYPGHLWAINVRGDQGIASIHNLMLSGEWGYILHLDKRYSISDLIDVAKRGAGELLERYNVARGKADMERMAHMAVSNTGRVIGDLSK